MSIVFYKFKSTREYNKCVFDGGSISVFALKREIMTAKNLGAGTDFDLVIYNAQTSEEYKDDLQLIPRNTSVLVSRRPVSRAGRGVAKRYVDPTILQEVASSNSLRYRPSPDPMVNGNTAKNNSSINGVDASSEAATEGVIAEPAMEQTSVMEGITEEERINNMFKQQAKQWQATQKGAQSHKQFSQKDTAQTDANSQLTSLVGNVPTSKRPARLANQHGAKIENGALRGPQKQTTKALFPGYICYRCGKKGHFISNCPTLGDKGFDRPKLKRTTGIPRIFLKTVNEAQKNNGSVMIAQTGEFVIAQPNYLEWQKLYPKTRCEVGVGDIYELIESECPDEYKCKICGKICRDPVSTSCCGSVYCDECIRSLLLDHINPNSRLKCPSCLSSQAPDCLVPREDIQKSIEQLQRDFLIRQNCIETPDGQQTLIQDHQSQKDGLTREPAKIDSNTQGPNKKSSSKETIFKVRNYVVPRRKPTEKPFTIISNSPKTNSPSKQCSNKSTAGSLCSQNTSFVTPPSRALLSRIAIRQKSGRKPFVIISGPDSVSDVDSITSTGNA